MTTFADLNLDEKILIALERMGYKTPSPIQTQAIPLVLEGRDLIALAETGSGKTAACAIPICHKVDPARPEVQALIVVPTRELALQYAVETQKIGKEKGVSAFALYGGEDMGLQQAKLKAGCQVLVATPGRLIDLIYQRLIDLRHVETLILDEADEMLSMGFYEDLEFIIQCLVHDHQTLLFSATMPAEIKKIAQAHMKEPAEVALITGRSGPESLDHFFVYCPEARERLGVLEGLFRKMEPRQSLIFCRSREQTEEVAKALRRKFQQVDFLHGGLAQPVRTVITNKFRRGQIRYLVVTDVASRGLDFSGVTHVFLFHLSHEVDLYTHRVGRAGRSGRTGVAVTLVTRREVETVPKILKRIDRPAQWIGSPPPAGGGGEERPPRRAPRRSQRRGA
ncbi:MAG: DEAD/DEAH box helicase [Parachlamydiales bacterium]